ncbi:hypothetical protein ACW910_24305 (plasmid) [Burkholderia ambifaria]
MDKTENRFYRESAFPELNPNRLNPNPGMTLRDYFAAKAMHAALASVKPGPMATHQEIAEIVAPIAYMIADAMLRAREN